MATLVRSGDICKHQFRKSALYLVIVEAHNRFHMVRVKKQAGYPIASTGRYRERDITKLEVVDHVDEYESLTREECLRSKHLDLGPALPPVENLKGFSEEVVNQFADLASQLSPENLCCDGELRLSQVRSRHRQILRDWKTLEMQIGFSVTEGQVWEVVSERYNNDVR